MSSINNHSSRDYNIDLLKIISCTAVVGLHTFQKDVSLVLSTLYYLCGFAVPIFFMCSGAFLMNRHGITCKYIIYKIWSILRVVIIWNAMIIAVQLIAKVVLHTDYTLSVLLFPKEIIKSLVQRSVLWQFWYFGALILLYCLVLIMNRLNEKQRIYLLAAVGTGSMALQILSIIMGAPVQKDIIQTFRLWTWIFYFIAGGVIHNRMLQKEKYGGGITKILIAVTVFILIYQNLIGRYVITESVGILHAEYFYDSVFTMIWVIILFMWGKNLKLNDKIRRFISEAAPLTMGIYIVHPIIMSVYRRFIVIDTAIMSLAYFVLVLVSSAIFSWNVNKNSVFRYLIKL